MAHNLRVAGSNPVATPPASCSSMDRAAMFHKLLSLHFCFVTNALRNYMGRHTDESQHPEFGMFGFDPRHGDLDHRVVERFLANLSSLLLRVNADRTTSTTDAPRGVR